MLSDKTNALADITEGNKENSNNIISDSESNFNVDKKNSFVLYNSYYYSLNCLTDEELGQIFRAILTFKALNEELPLTGSLQALFYMIKNQLNIDNDKYIKKCETNRLNGLKGGAPIGNKNAKKNTIDRVRLVVFFYRLNSKD